MNFGGLGLQGKFVVALLVATALPFGLGLVVFESSGYRQLLSQRGKFHQIEATSLARALEQATDASGDCFRTWLAADTTLVDYVTTRNLAGIGEDPDQAALETERVDKLWESLDEADPLARAVLENDASVNLRNFMKVHPAIAEVLATDNQGRLVSATGKSTDYYQADEQWWQVGAALANGHKRDDILNFDSSSNVFSIDVTLPLIHDGKFAGVAKLSVDVTSLFTQLGYNGEDLGERWEIILPDGRVLASSKHPFTPLGENVTEPTLHEITTRKNGWALVQTDTGEARMAGFVGLGPAGTGAQRPCRVFLPPGRGRRPAATHVPEDRCGLRRLAGSLRPVRLLAHPQKHPPAARHPREPPPKPSPRAQASAIRRTATTRKSSNCGPSPRRISGKSRKSAPATKWKSSPEISPS